MLNKNYIFIFIVFFTTFAEAKFVRDSNSSVVLDTKTNLIWEDTISTQIDYANVVGYWEQAMSHCEGLSINGLTNWRMPNINELRTIVDYNSIGPAISNIFLFIGPTTSGDKINYWSSTTYIGGDTSKTWYINFYYGDISFGDKTSALDSVFCRCVHDR